MLLARIAYIFLMSLFSVGVFSRPVIINGSVTGAAGMKIELLTYSDLISNIEIVMAETIIGQDALFELSPEIETTTFAFLKIGIQKCEILLEAGKNYHLKITGLLSENLRNKDIAPFQIPALQLEILNPWRFELNSLVDDFYSFHDRFISDNSLALLRQRDAGIVKQYIGELYSLFPGIDNTWFNDLLTYKIASVETMAKVKGRETIAGQYLQNRQILYSHIIYMDFFQQFFDKYLITTRLYNRKSMVDAMESPQSLSLMMDMLGKDPVLKDLRLRELVLIANMLDLSVTQGFKQETIIKLLEKVQTDSKYTQHQLIAKNLIIRLLNR